MATTKKITKKTTKKITRKKSQKTTKKAAAKKPVKRVKKVHIEGNLEVHPGFGILALNPGLFPLPVVYAASQKFLDKVYILVDGDPGEEIIIEMRPRKQRVNLVDIGRELSNLLVKELENYHKYTSPALNRYVYAVVGRSAVATEQAPKQVQEQDESPGHGYEKDPLGIMKPHSGGDA